jgi:catechol-2,3-dioxygenase
MARVVQLGHVGIYVRDLEKMVAFYRDFLGMQITKQNWERGMVFLSADPVASDHEIALMRGRPEHDDPHLINQISMRVETLDDLRDFHGRVVSGGYQIERVVNHGSAIGCYFKDPEGNTTEVFWRSPRDCWVPTGDPIDLSQSDAEIMAQVNAAADRSRDVPVGGVRTPAAAPAGA